MVKALNNYKIIAFFPLICLAFLVALMLCPCSTLASGSFAETKELWWEKRDYPFDFGDEALNSFPYGEQIQLLNPPDDLLQDFSTKELAELVLRYPLLEEMTWIEKPYYFYGVLEEHSTIFLELLCREGGIDELLEVYESLAPEEEEMKSCTDWYLAFFEIPAIRAEIFMKEFVLAYGERFSRSQKEKYLAIYTEKKERYYSLMQDGQDKNYVMRDIDFQIKMEEGIAAASTLEAQWYEKRDYPITPEDPSWELRSFDELKRVLNPPEDLLKEFSSQELTDLVLRYPFLQRYNDYGTARQFFNNFLEKNSDIFKELLSRDDGIAQVLKAYENNDVNIEVLNCEGLKSFDESVMREVFFFKFIEWYSGWRFHDEEKELCKQILTEKRNAYEGIDEEEVKEAFMDMVASWTNEIVTKDALNSEIVAPQTEEESNPEARKKEELSVQEEKDQEQRRNPGLVFCGCFAFALIMLGVIVNAMAKKTKR